MSVGNKPALDIDAQAALVFTMLLACRSVGNVAQPELDGINSVMRLLPVFSGFDFERLPIMIEQLGALTDDEDGLDQTLEVIRDALPDYLRDTAYVLAADICQADGKLEPEEERLLELLAQCLGIDSLTAAAIGHAAKARYMTL